MAKIRDDENEYGTPITVLRCEFCNNIFTICPALKEDELQYWKGCTDPTCESYNPNRDVEALVFFGVCEIKRQ